MACGGKNNMAIDRTDLEWKEISTKHIIKNEWIDFRESAYRFPDEEFRPHSVDGFCEEE